MAKRNTRKSDPDDTVAPERRQAARNGSAAPRVRTTRSRKTNKETAGTAVSNGHDVPGGTAEASARDAQTEAHARWVDVPHDQIADRAYHLYLERGGRGGDSFQDWITAERELRERASGNRLR